MSRSSIARMRKIAVLMQYNTGVYAVVLATLRAKVMIPFGSVLRSDGRSRTMRCGEVTPQQPYEGKFTSCSLARDYSRPMGLSTIFDKLPAVNERDRESLCPSRTPARGEGGGRVIIVTNISLILVQCGTTQCGPGPIARAVAVR